MVKYFPLPVIADQIKEKSCVDDLCVTEESCDSLRQRTKEADEILEHANMKVKNWIVSRDDKDPVKIG